MSADLYQLITEVIGTHKPEAKSDVTTRPGYRIWHDGCTCGWVGKTHLDSDALDEHVGRAVGDLLIDLAGTGRLLASIDRIARFTEPGETP